MDIITKNIAKIKQFGYNAELEFISGESYYISVFDFGTNEFYFILRFSDHCLNKWNYIPAGVITDDFYLANDEVITKYTLDVYIECRKRMSKNEIEELFTNRRVEDLYI